MIHEVARAGWWDDAACRGRTDLFYATDLLSQQIAVGVCRSCPVREQCEGYVRSVEPSYQRSGVVAGFTAGERRGWDSNAHSRID